MSIGILGTPVEIAAGGTYTPESGSNRVVLFIPKARRTGAPTLTSVTYKGTVRTPQEQINDSAGATRNSIGGCVFKESELAAGGTTVTVTWSAAPSSQSVTAMTLGDVDQSTTVRGSASAIGSTSALSVTLSPTAGDLAIGAFTNRNGAEFTISNSYTQRTTGVNGDGGRYLSASKSAAGSGDNFACTLVNGVGTPTADDWAALALAFIPLASGASVTGSGGGTSPAATASGTAARSATASTANPTITKPVVSGAGVKGITGTGNVIITRVTLVGTGAGVGNTSGLGAATIQRATSTGVGTRGLTDNAGDIAISFGSPPAVIAGTGVKGIPLTGTGALSTTLNSSVSGIAGRGWTGTGALTSSVATASGTGAKNRALTGTGALNITIPTALGSTGIGKTGTGALTAPKATVTGFAAGVIDTDFSERMHAVRRACTRAVRYAHGRRD